MFGVISEGKNVASETEHGIKVVNLENEATEEKGK